MTINRASEGKPPRGRCDSVKEACRFSFPAFPALCMLSSYLNGAGARRNSLHPSSDALAAGNFGRTNDARRCAGPANRSRHLLCGLAPSGNSDVKDTAHAGHLPRLTYIVVRNRPNTILNGFILELFSQPSNRNSTCAGVFEHPKWLCSQGHSRPSFGSNPCRNA